jgi:anti-anti-sigma regulatory factor
MCGSDPRISEWSIADAHVPARTYPFLVGGDRLERLDLTGRLISVSSEVHRVVNAPLVGEHSRGQDMSQPEVPYVCTITRHGSDALVYVVGDLDSAALDSFGECLDKLDGIVAERIRIDLTNVSAISSRAVEILLRKHGDVPVMIFGASEPIRAALDAANAGHLALPAPRT